METQCPYCNQYYDVDDKYNGSNVNCTNCNREFMITSLKKDICDKIDDSSNAIIPNRDMMFCPECGTQISRNSIHCCRCGALIQKHVTGFSGGAKSRMAYILLGLFLGGVGIHDFYAGYTMHGVLKIILFITFWGAFISCIWALFDIISTTKDAQGVPMQ